MDKTGNTGKPEILCDIDESELSGVEFVSLEPNNKDQEPNPKP